MKRGVVGIDEAGRGPLAGPVSVGTCYIRSGVTLKLRGLKDSKKLTQQQRELWYAQMKKWQKERKIRFSVSLVSHLVIDKKGIVPAVSLGIKRSLKKLKLKSHNISVFLDGGLRAPSEYKKQKTIIKGDEKIPVISLASIAAKVTRDRYMTKLAKKYPNYRFEIHKGYGTRKHVDAIKKNGISKVHRKTFLKSF